MNSLPLRILGDRVLVKPDILDHAPEVTASGVLMAASLAAAVTGADPMICWHRGTVIAVGTAKHPRYADAMDAIEQLREWPNEDFPLVIELLQDLVRRTPCCAIGDDVVFAADVGQAITLMDETYLLLNATDLLAIVEPEETHA